MCVDSLTIYFRASGQAHNSMTLVQKILRHKWRLLGGGIACWATGSSALVAWRRNELKVWIPPVRTTSPFVSGEGLLDIASARKRDVLHRLIVMWCRLLILWLDLGVCAVLYCVRMFDASESRFHAAVLRFLITMGPTFIKLGQWLASRPDIFPPELCKVLSKLFDRAPPHSWAYTEEVLRRDDVLRHLASIETKPLNSGSVAQVHRGVLREDVDGIAAGTPVVVKVMHPHIGDTIAADIAAMNLVVRLVEAVVPSAVYFDGRKALSEFSSLIQSQLDLRRECDNLAQFRYNFRDFDNVVFPAPAPSISSSEVLVETYEDGLPLQDYVPSAGSSKLADVGTHMFLKMLFEDNFVHSDLHPGNVLIRDAPRRSGVSSTSQQLVILDPGLVTTLSEKERHNFISLFAAVACGDGDLGATLMLDRMPKSSCPNREKFQKDMKEIFDIVGPGTAGFRLSDVDLGGVLSRILTTVRENRATIDGNFASLVVTVIVGEAMGRKLQSNFNIFAEAAPYMMEYLKASELKFLVTKLHDTYGTAGLLIDTVRLDKTNTYVNVAAQKSKEMIGGLTASA